MATNLSIRIFCDGGARGNPGPAASAFIVLDHSGQTLHEQGFYLGTATNNQAEYQAVVEALTWLVKTYAQSPANTLSLIACDFFLDSLLVVNQLTGLYKIKDSILQQKNATIKNILSTHPNFTVKFTYIPRMNNSRADSLVNTTLDSSLYN